MCHLRHLFIYVIQVSWQDYKCVCASERECAPLATLVFAHPTAELDAQGKRWTSNKDQPSRQCKDVVRKVRRVELRSQLRNHHTTSLAKVPPK